MIMNVNQHDTYLTPSTVGVILPMLSGFYMGEITSTLRFHAQRLGVNLVFYRVGHRRDFDSSFAFEHIDALLVVLHAAAYPLIERALDKDIPVLSIGASYAPLMVEQLSSDQASGVAALYRHLVELGHSKIGFCGDLSVNDVRMRFKSFQSQVKTFQHEFTLNQLFNVRDASLHGGRIAAKQFCERNAPCSAIICATDHCAIGLMEMLALAGVEVPKEVAVVGVDNIFLGERCHPTLTTVDQGLEQLAQMAIRRLLERVNGAPYQSEVSLLAQSLVVRESSGEVDTTSSARTEGQRPTDRQLNSMSSRSIRAQLLCHSDHSPAELHETLYSQGQAGFSSIANANCLFDMNIAWAIDGSRAKGESFVYSDNYILDRTPASSLTQRISLEAYPSNDATCFPHHFVMTLLCVAIPEENREHILAVLEDISGSPNLSKLASYHHYLDMLALFLERDALLESAKSKAKYSSDLANQLQIVNNSSNDAIWDWDLTSDQLHWNSRLLDILDFPKVEEYQVFPSQEFFKRVHADDLAELEEKLTSHLDTNNTFKAQFRLQHSDGHYLWVSASGHAIRDAYGRPERLLGAMTDITEQKRSAEKIQRLAYFDPLTGVANRRRMTDTLTTHINENQGQPKAIMLMDLNRFKVVNDTYGHGVGDALLCYVASVLQKAVRKNDLIARFGGDEFLFMCDVETTAQALELAGRLLRAVETPFVHDGIELRTQGSIGIAFYPHDALQADDLIKKADMAMYRAKESKSRKAVHYNASMATESLRLISIEVQLKSAIKNEVIEVWYQPILGVNDQSTKRVEALSRWKNDQGVEISPDVFIKIAEESGQIKQLSDYVLMVVCQDMVSRRIPSDYIVSINLSVSQLTRAHFTTQFIQCILSHELDPERFIIDITETVAITDLDQSIISLSELRGAGIKVALDDFGTGFSSLSLLKKLPLDEVKIDKTFIHDLDGNSANQVMLKSLILMSHAFGYHVVAEGVETKEQLQIIQSLGCDYVQGYFFDKPMSIEKLSGHLIDRYHDMFVD
ncbi:EAL domain-containing protein [Vibrio sp. 10N.222.51.C12]